MTLSSDERIATKDAIYEDQDNCDQYTDDEEGNDCEAYTDSEEEDDTEDTMAPARAPEPNEAQRQKLQEIQDGPMQAELKYLDKKWTDKGQTYFAETVNEDTPQQIDWWEKYALCLTRQLDRQNKVVQKTTLQVNSQPLRDILKDVIGFYPGISFNTKNIAIDLPCRVLFHYHKELSDKHASLSHDTDEHRHLGLLLDFVKEQFKDTMAESANLSEQGLMSFDHLWTIFRPGCTIIAPVLGQPRAFNLTSYNYMCMCNTMVLALGASFVDFDGTNFGTQSTQLIIPTFVGAEPTKEMEAFPIDFHPSPTDLKSRLIARGRRFEGYAGMHFAQYSGVALEQVERGFSRINVVSRVVVDCKTYHRHNANHAFNLAPLKDQDESPKTRKQIHVNGKDHNDSQLIPDTAEIFVKLSDEQCMLCSARVRGFSFAEKRWLDFLVDKLSPIEWNPQCFDQLVLAQQSKDLVRALVAEHTQNTDTFDDIVKGKGKGLILVLHGPPGVGKTLTAECVAEYSKRPLYIVSSGDLGTDSEVLDARLSKILDMASTWKAVLLIDEADVFLERRSLHDMERNALVSIFLRVLEYYEGILFLTSNRVNTFDDAFKSRIHVPLKYNDLPVSSRIQVWRNFLEKVEGGVDVDDAGYEELGQPQLNGRQIKNIIRTAKSLAKYDGKKLDLSMLQHVIGIQMDFEGDLTSQNGFNGVNSNKVNGHA